MLTFEEWQATRTKNRRDNQYRYKYNGDCLIKINQGWAIDAYGRYNLTIGNWSQDSNDLADLELQLYNLFYVPNTEPKDMQATQDDWESAKRVGCVDFANGTEL